MRQRIKPIRELWSNYWQIPVLEEHGFSVSFRRSREVNRENNRRTCYATAVNEQNGKTYQGQGSTPRRSLNHLYFTVFKTHQPLKRKEKVR